MYTYYVIARTQSIDRVVCNPLCGSSLVLWCNYDGIPCLMLTFTSLLTDNCFN